MSGVRNSEILWETWWVCCQQFPLAAHVSLNCSNLGVQSGCEQEVCWWWLAESSKYLLP